jgi:nucleotide-binding universal stress UspA family protein
MTVVIAYTNTPLGRAALTAGVAEAVGSAEEVVLVPSERDTTLPADAELSGIIGDALLDQLRTAGGHVVVEHGDLADPSDAVVQVAQRRSARLIVVGLPQRSPLGKVLLGSTAQRILLDASCAVLAVKATPER